MLAETQPGNEYACRTRFIQRRPRSLMGWSKSVAAAELPGSGCGSTARFGKAAPCWSHGAAQSVRRQSSRRAAVVTIMRIRATLHKYMIQRAIRNQWFVGALVSNGRKDAGNSSTQVDYLICKMGRSLRGAHRTGFVSYESCQCRSNRSEQADSRPERGL